MMNKEQGLIFSGAASSLLIPQAISQVLPETLAKAAPLVQNLSSSCTGVCGSCGGTCLTGLCAMGYLGAVALWKKNK